MNSPNRFGHKGGNSGDDENRFVERDYSIGGGVTMEHRNFEHGFGGAVSIKKDDRFPGTSGSVRGEQYGKGPKNWHRTDEKLREEVCEALARARMVDASDIDVSVEDGIVLLTGWVNDRQEKRQAEDCLDDVLGIHDIRNELHLRDRKLKGNEGLS